MGQDDQIRNLPTLNGPLASLLMSLVSSSDGQTLQSLHNTNPLLLAQHLATLGQPIHCTPDYHEHAIVLDGGDWSVVVKGEVYASGLG